MKSCFIFLTGVWLLAAGALVAGCNAQTDTARAEDGDTVQIHYTGKLEDGTIFDTSTGREPLEFTLGTGQVIPGFEQAVLGMKVGDSKTVTIPAEEAYGEHRDELVTEVSLSQFPDGLAPKVGQKFQVMTKDGNTVTVTVTDVTEAMATVDANHPLAGKNLIFQIQLVAIK